MRMHFIGIGGIGVSALAKYYLEKGHKVSGSDLVSSEITEALRKKGAKLFIGKHEASNLPREVDLVIYSLAIPRDNPELKEATVRDRISNMEILSYPQALGELTKKYFTIAVSGTHGKSTTAAMIGLLLTKAGLEPTVILGTKLKEFGDSNFRMGGFPKSKILNLKSKILIIEADEWHASFLNYWPKIIVLTNIEREHLDYYKNLKNILRTYKEYIGHLPKDGVLVANRDDKNIPKIINPKNSKSPLLRSGELFAKKIRDYSLGQKEVSKIKEVLKIPGEYNVYNALAALTVARILKIPDKISFKILSEYRGSWRRFDISKISLKRTIVRIKNKGKREGGRRITLISDYGHHPTEIRVTLKAAREKYLYPPKFSRGKLGRARKKIWCVFQPHQYQRTYYLFKDFVKVFKEAPIDRLIITDIYDVAGREEKKIKKKVNSQELVKAIKNSKTPMLQCARVLEENVVYLSGSKEFKKIVQYLKENLRGGEVVIIMGAGDIYKLSYKL